MNNSASSGVGGHFYINRTQPLVAVILTKESTFINSDDLEFGDPHEGELRCGAIEQKVKSTKREVDLGPS